MIKERIVGGYIEPIMKVDLCGCSPVTKSTSPKKLSRVISLKIRQSLFSEKTNLCEVSSVDDATEFAIAIDH